MQVVDDAARKSAHKLNDLPLTTDVSPKNVSGMIDFSVKIFAASSGFLAYFTANSASSCSLVYRMFLVLCSVLGLADVNPQDPRRDVLLASMQQTCLHLSSDQSH